MSIITYKNENQIYADFKSFVEVVLNNYDITGWEVKQLNQTIKTEDLTPCVYLSILRNKQKGAEYRKNTKKQNEKYFKQYSVKQEVSIRFQATKRRKITDDKTTYNGKDVLAFISAYFQTIEGIHLLNNNGYVQFKGTDIQSQSFTNDDENIQLMPYFDCNYLYTDIFEQKINKISFVVEKIKKGF